VVWDLEAFVCWINHLLLNLLGKWLHNLTSFGSRLWEPNINVAHSLLKSLTQSTTWLQIWRHLLRKIMTLLTRICPQMAILVFYLFYRFLKNKDNDALNVHPLFNHIWHWKVSTQSLRFIQFFGSLSVDYYWQMQWERIVRSRPEIIMHMFWDCEDAQNY
jgi:hypothetical protein